VYDPSAASSRLRIVPLNMGDAKATCSPVAFLGGLLTPTDAGMVRLLKTTDGSDQLLPFQPKMEPGERITWKRPAVVGPGGREFVIADDRNNLYRVGVKDQPAANLTELTSNHLNIELATGLAASGETLYGVVRASAGDTVVAISAGGLQVVKEFDLQGGRVTWGPESVGEVVLLVTDEKLLHGYGAAQAAVWPKPAVMHGQPAGRPLVLDGGDYVFASVSGTVWRISASGDESGKAELGEPLGAGPVAFGRRLLLCGNDGSLHVIPMPSAAGETGSGS
jgi:hypothetical protein